MRHPLKWGHALTHAAGYGTAIWFVHAQDPKLCLAYVILMIDALLLVADIFADGPARSRQSPPGGEDDPGGW